MKEATREHLVNASEALAEALGEWVSVTELYQPDAEHRQMLFAKNEIQAALESE